MSKKFLTVFTALCVASSAFCLSACSDNNQSQTETPDNIQTGDNTDGTNNGDASSTVSAAERSEIIADIGDTLIDSVLPSADSQTSQSLKISTFSAVRAESGLTDDEIYTADISEYTMWIQLGSSYIFMLSEFYKNPNYPVSDSPESVTGTFSASGDEISTALLIADYIDETENSITIQIDFTSEGISSPEQSGYVYLVADYDFTTGSVGAINISILSEAASVKTYIFARYKNGRTLGVSTEYAQIASYMKEDLEEKRSQFKSLKSSATDAGDMSAEIEAANNYLNDKLY